MPKRLRAVILVVACLLSAAFADERILDFHSDIKVQPDAGLLVHEVIRVNSEGVSIRHGIFHDFSTSYKDRLGQDYVVNFQVDNVRRDGLPESYELESLSNGVRVRIGSPERTLDPGEDTYEITYTVTRELGFFPDHDELYWNVTGNGWEFPIDHASATVTFPAAVNAADLKLTGYTGIQGSRSQNLTFAATDASTVSFETTFPLMAREGLTIVVGFPKGLVKPTQSDRLSWALQDNAPAVAGFIGLVVVALYYWLVRKSILRVSAPGAIVVSYEPPPGLSPAAVRYLRHMGYDDRALAGNVVDLAVKKCVSIRQEGGTYNLTRLKEHDDKLPADEQRMLRSLFGNNPELPLNKHGALVVARKILTKNLKAQEGHRLFRKNGKLAVNGILLSLGTAAAMLLATEDLALDAGFLMVWLSGWSVGVILLVAEAVQNWKTKQLDLGDIVMPLLFAGAEVVVLGILGVEIGILPMLMLFGLVLANGIGIHFLRAYTPEGRKLMDQIEGFRQYLLEVDSDRLQRLNPPEKTPALFEKCLPYALALGVEQAWTKQFSGVLTQAAAADVGGTTLASSPDWLLTKLGDTFDTGHFASSFSGHSSSAVSSASTSPGSSSGSSGGDGGGSSGGGGGGGGGGGW